jgi:hypothetical protein
VRAYYREIDKPSMTFRRETITSIDPTTRKVATDRSTYQADVLVVASALISTPLQHRVSSRAGTSSTPSTARPGWRLSCRRSLPVTP